MLTLRGASSECLFLWVCQFGRQGCPPGPRPSPCQAVDAAGDGRSRSPPVLDAPPVPPAPDVLPGPPEELAGPVPLCPDCVRGWSGGRDGREGEDWRMMRGEVADRRASGDADREAEERL